MKTIHSSAESSFRRCNWCAELKVRKAESLGERKELSSTVNGRENIVERRQYPRGGVVGRLEDITYSVLRDYEVIGEAA